MMKRTVRLLISLFLLMSPDAAKAWDMGNLSIHGFASTGYLKSDHNNYLLPSEEGSFEFNEVGLNFSTSIAKNMRVGLQLYSFDLGNIGNNQIKLDWAFLDYTWKDYLSLRVGRLKTPLGLYNETQDYDMLRTAILLPQCIYNKYQREMTIGAQGLDLYGRLTLSRAGRLAYDLYVGTSEISPDGGVAKIISQNGVDVESARMKYLAGGRLQWYTPLRGFKISGTFIYFSLEYQGTLGFGVALPPSVTMNIPIDLDIVLDGNKFSVFSAEYDFGRLTLAGEYSLLRSDSEIASDLSGIGIPVTRQIHRDIKREAYYALVSYRLLSWFELGMYYAIYNEEEDHVSDGVLDTQKDLAVSTRFDINESWLVKMEVHFMAGAGLVADIDNAETNRNYDPKWTLFALKTTFNF